MYIKTVVIYLYWYLKSKTIEILKNDKFKRNMQALDEYPCRQATKLNISQNPCACMTTMKFIKKEIKKHTHKKETIQIFQSV